MDEVADYSSRCPRLIVDPARVVDQVVADAPQALGPRIVSQRLRREVVDELVS